MVALGACGSPTRDVLTLPNAPTSTVALGTDFTLAPGESVLVDGAGTALTFVGVTGDSRCPSSELLQCVWAGSVQLAMRATTAAGVRVLPLETVAHRDTASVGEHLVTLRSVAPARLMFDSIPPASYRATLQITRKN